jgi:hypothetical protein
MACPYFDPLTPCHADGSAMLPLGDFWEGVCRAIPGQPHAPAREIQHPTCNLGYARGLCPHFPASPGPDAVRFTIRRESRSSISLFYVLESDHHPFAYGPLDYSLEAAGFTGSHPDAVLQRQARAYVASYLRRKQLP